MAQNTVVLPAGPNLLDRMKSRQSTAKLIKSHEKRLIDGEFPDAVLLLFDSEAEQLDVKGVWKQRRLTWSATEFLVGSKRDDGTTKLIETIPLHEITAIENKGESGIARDFLKYLHIGRGGGGTSTTGFQSHKDLGSTKQFQEAANPRASQEIERENSNAFDSLDAGPASPPRALAANNTLRTALSHEDIDMERATIIKTVSDGFNCGRSYIVRCHTDEETDEFLSQLRLAIEKAVKHQRKKSRFQESQLYFQSLWASLPFQSIIAIFIAANFIVNCATAQILPEDGSHEADVFEVIEIVFTAIFTLELVLNAYAHWFWPFLRDGWNILDVIVIVISIISLSFSHLQGFSVLRLTRAFRILRLFGRLKTLKKIITGLMMSIMPVVNAFLITVVVTMIYGIVGVTIFKDESDQFENFTRAMHTLFLLVVGEPWVESIPAFREDGTLNHEISLYVISYVLVVTWTLLQVGVAVLLDNYISATNVMEMEAAEQRASDNPTRAVAHILDPLLDFLTRTYDSQEDLSQRIHRVFATIDSDGSGDLSLPELMTGLKRLNIEPRIHASTEDIDAFFTFAGFQTTQDMKVTQDIFEQSIRVHCQDYTRRMITDTMLRYHTTSLDPTVTIMASFKTAISLLEDNTRSNQRDLKEVDSKLDQILARLDAQSSHSSAAGGGVAVPTAKDLRQKINGVDSMELAPVEDVIQEKERVITVDLNRTDATLTDRQEDSRGLTTSTANSHPDPVVLVESETAGVVPGSTTPPRRRQINILNGTQPSPAARHAPLASLDATDTARSLAVPLPGHSSSLTPGAQVGSPDSRPESSRWKTLSGGGVSATADVGFAQNSQQFQPLVPPPPPAPPVHSGVTPAYSGGTSTTGKADTEPWYDIGDIDDDDLSVGSA